jgi:hypothetical protein
MRIALLDMGRPTMQRTYRALLRGDRIEWKGQTPSCEKDRPLEVEVTVLDDEPARKTGSRGEEMAAILEELAGMGAFSEIEDPVSWQRNTREDRTLPGRQD